MRTERSKKLQLTNDGALELFFIGVGSARSIIHHQTNFLIIKGDQHIMIDFGMTGPRAIHEVAGIEHTDINIVLPTHSHADHIGGFETLGIDNRYILKRRLKMIITEDFQRVLWTHSLQGGLQWNEIENNKMLSFSDYFEPIRPKWKSFSPRETYELDIGNIHLEMFRDAHIPEQAETWEASFISYGLFIDGHVFVSGDTKFDPSLIDLYADRSSIMFHDV